MTVPGYSGWGQRSPDFGHSSVGGPPPPARGRRRRTTWLLALVAIVGVLVGVAVLVLRADGAGDEQVAAEIQQRSQPPVINEARLVEDRLELDVHGPDDAEYCLDESLAPRDDGRPLCSRGVGDPYWFDIDDLEVDADDLEGREITVTAHSMVTTGGDGAVGFGTGMVSEPSEPVEIVDAR